MLCYAMLVERAVQQVQQCMLQALALVGYCAPTRGPGPSVLALDGGGIRGLIAIEVLRHLERLTGTRVNDLFDYIIGVSTGAIIAAVIGRCTASPSPRPRPRPRSLSLAHSLTSRSVSFVRRRRGQPGHGQQAVPHAVQGDVRQHLAHRR